MKKLILTALTFATVTGMVIGQQTKETTVAFAGDEKSACSWKTLTHDFGSIEQGKPVSFTYELTNSGKTPIVISRVQPGCGCTTQDYTKEPIAPGKKGSVTLTYNAASAGKFTKSATVTTDSESFVLTFSGEVIPKKATEKDNG